MLQKKKWWGISSPTCHGAPRRGWRSRGGGRIPNSKCCISPSCHDAPTRRRAHQTARAKDRTMTRSQTRQASWASFNKRARGEESGSRAKDSSELGFRLTDEAQGQRLSNDPGPDSTQRPWGLGAVGPRRQQVVIMTARQRLLKQVA